MSKNGNKGQADNTNKVRVSVQPMEIRIQWIPGTENVNIQSSVPNHPMAFGILQAAMALLMNNYCKQGELKASQKRPSNLVVPKIVPPKM